MEEAVKNIIQDKQKYLILYLQKIFSYFFLDLKSSIENYYNIFHIAPIFLFAICSIPGAIIGLREIKNSKIIYLFLLTCFLTAFIAIFFYFTEVQNLHYKFQILFSLFFFKYLFEKKKKNIYKMKNLFLFFYNFFENYIHLRRIKSFLSEKVELNDPIIFDVGSHQGKLAKLMYGLYKNSIIYCFEPNKSMNKYLKKIGNNIKVYNCALGEKNEKKKY